MKGYNSYKLVYIADDGTIENAIELTKNGDYLEGVLPHLSIYALVGNNVDETTNNPQTNDNVFFYISIFGLSIFALTTGGLYLKKKQNN